jgi:hypothetical protein
MTHPWLEISLSDYEAHMALPSVGQSRLLASTLHRVSSTFRPRALAVLGAAGGNGLERVDPAIVRRVVALDFNAEFLAVCADRHAVTFCQFQPILPDLSRGAPSMEPVECVYAGLVLEYLVPELFCAYLPSLLTDGGVFAALLQRPSLDLPKVSASPFQSLAKLQSVFSFVSPKRMRDALVMHGFTFIEDEQIDLVSGKSFYYAAYRKGEPNDGDRPRGG